MCDELIMGRCVYSVGTLLKTNREHDFVFFWGHTENPGRVTNACFSQWYSSKFELSGNAYCCAEQAMMAAKARIMDDSEIEKLILKANDPKKIKALGRMVRNFSEERWDEEKRDVVFLISLCKFIQNIDLCDYLLGTGDAVLVEASPYDRIWGIGMTRDDPDAKNPSKWKGDNLLGFILMEVRDVLRLAERMEYDKIINLIKTNDGRDTVDIINSIFDCLVK